MQLSPTGLLHLRQALSYTRLVDLLVWPHEQAHLQALVSHVWQTRTCVTSSLATTNIKTLGLQPR